MSKEAEKKQARNKNEKREEQHARSKEIAEENGTLELANALKEEKKRSEDYLNRLKYMQADFENLKKRLDNQIKEIRKYSNERLVLELLGIVDELEVAIQETKQAQSVEILLKGVEMTLKKLKKVLELEEVSPIDCIGQTFDPSKHEVVAKIESEEEGIIIEEIRKGYIMKGKVIRPSAVKIAAKSSLKATKEVEQSEQ
ncbi:MAG: nucleotide exchange factor GrpE [Candidatus Bathyarchaeota archaeon]|nr:nucleotide exchange factor GrpE [Candidatus Bathyarchaeota archaeon]MDH5494623.1 nucleotide exchange factor GrpE [Candidatus Bathyarchaeota archaeon]